MDPVDDFLKTAGLKDMWNAFVSGAGGGVGKSFGEAMASGVGAAVPAAVVAGSAMGIAKGFDAIRERTTKARDYKAMLDSNPSLRKYDASQVQMVFNTLRTQAPALSKDPLIANSFVRKIIDYSPEAGPFIDPATAKMLTDTELSVSKTRSERGPIISSILRPGGRPGKP